ERQGRGAPAGGSRRGPRLRPRDGGPDDGTGRAVLHRKLPQRGQGQGRRGLRQARGLLPGNPEIPRRDPSPRMAAARPATRRNLPARAGSSILNTEVARAASLSLRLRPILVKDGVPARYLRRQVRDPPDVPGKLRKKSNLVGAFRRTRAEDF